MKNLKTSVDGFWMLSQGTDSSEVSSTDGILDLALQGPFEPSGLHNSKLVEFEAKSALICYSICLTANSTAISQHRFYLHCKLSTECHSSSISALGPHNHPYLTRRSSCSELGFSAFWTVLSPHTVNSMREKTAYDSSLGLST